MYCLQNNLELNCEKNNDSNNPVSVATIAGHIDCVKYHKESNNWDEFDCEKACIIAIKKDRADILKYIIQNSVHNSCVYYAKKAIKHLSLNCLRFLLEDSFDDEENEVPIYAIYSQNMDCIKMLIDLNYEFKSPLQYALETDNIDIILFFIDSHFEETRSFTANDAISSLGYIIEKQNQIIKQLKEENRFCDIYTCDQCGLSYSLKENLTKHIEKLHN